MTTTIESRGVVGFEGFSMSSRRVDSGDDSSIAGWVELRHRVFGEVAAFAGLPLVVHVGEDGADEADHGRFVREDADHPGS